MFYRESSRRHRDRGYYPGYLQRGYYEDSDAYESVEQYSYATRKRKRSLCAKRCLVCNGDFRKPFEALSCYDPFEEDMDFVHQCSIAMEAGRIIAQDAADRIEAVSKMINRAYGYDPSYKQWSRFLAQMARGVQQLPDQGPYWPGRPHVPTSFWLS